MRHDCGDGIGEEGERHEEEDLFDAVIRATGDDEPDADGGQRHRDVFGDTDQLTGGGDARKFRDRDEDVGEEECHHGEGGAAYTEALANQVGEALARGRAHPRAHLLDHRQRDRDQHQRPEQAVAVARANTRPGGDGARVVARVGGDQAGAEKGEKQQWAGESAFAPAAQTTQIGEGAVKRDFGGTAGDKPALCQHIRWGWNWLLQGAPPA